MKKSTSSARQPANAKTSKKGASNSVAQNDSQSRENNPKMTLNTKKSS